MVEQIEILSLDLSYEGCRMKSKDTEKRLLSSILENGIYEPLQGVDANERRILLNGFKRYRCAQKLGIHIVPYSSLGRDEALGIIELMRISNSKSLTILEQAKLIDELKRIHTMNNLEISRLLEKSKSWVSMRVGIMEEMSDYVIHQILNGEFPAYAYMYTLRQFIRMNRIKKEDINEFVRLASGKNLSIRDIETLAHGYFKGSDEFREQIKSGNILWGLNQLKENSIKAVGCSEFEQVVLKDLEITQKYIQRIICKISDQRLKTNSFFAQANLLSGGILRQTDQFSKAIKEFYDKTRQS